MGKQIIALSALGVAALTVLAQGVFKFYPEEDRQILVSEAETHAAATEAAELAWQVFLGIFYLSPAEKGACFELLAQ